MASAPQAVVDLVQRYLKNRDNYRRAEYNETQVRVEFIDPLFMALGWDVHNERGAAPQYCDVVHEASVRIRGSVRSPDYAFRMGPKEVFYVEAKKPSVNIHHSASPAYQLRRYAWTAKLPVSVLTDFEELSIYEGRRSRPSPEDNAATARVMYLTCDEYVERWDEIAGVLSKDAVMRGDLDRFADKAVGKRGTQEVDAAFLAEIENWRQLLAHNLALRNVGLSIRALNYAVQKIIDRIIFLRIAEDRGIEPYEELRRAAAGESVYPRLLTLFSRADAKYNSGLFHFEDEKGHNEERDTITPSLAVDDKALREIITSLYYPTCPYEFSVLGADILGHVYEQFLGSVISLTTGHRAKIEQKPEVRKAGGVYYTPTYIVDYIVQQTVGKLVEGKSPGQVAHLRILDPACGSGSFLLGAYQFLLDWHLTWYAEHQDVKQRPEIYTDEHGQPRLTIETKKTILTNNIYGVDIDGQAVEVTKLSLLLKVLEGENETSLGVQQIALSFGGKRALPDLSANIQCGNSLIGSDYLAQAALAGDFMTEDEMYRVNPFDWETAFPEVFGTHGGFDAVIGNPPYGVPFTKEELSYFAPRYPLLPASKDSYWMFMRLGHDLCTQQGLTAMIVPNTFCDLESLAQFRGWFLSQTVPIKIWQTGWAFKSAVVDTLVFVFRKDQPSPNQILQIEIGSRSYPRRIVSFQNSSLSKIDYRNTEAERSLLVRLAATSDTVGTHLSVKAGTKLYERGKGSPKQTSDTLKQRPYTSNVKISDDWRILYRGKHIGRYILAKSDEYVRYGEWLAAPRDAELFDSPKLLMRRTDDRLRTCLELDSAVAVNSCHVMKLNSSSQLSYEYILGLLNSKVLQAAFRLQNPQMVGKVFAEIKVVYVTQLPIRTIDFDDPVDVVRHDQMVALVERMLDLHKQLGAAALPQQKKMLQRQIEAIDKQIDQLVYELYGLTEDEIRIVEEALKP